MSTNARFAAKATYIPIGTLVATVLMYSVNMYISDFGKRSHTLEKRIDVLESLKQVHRIAEKDVKRSSTIKTLVIKYVKSRILSIENRRSSTLSETGASWMVSLMRNINELQMFNE